MLKEIRIPKHIIPLLILAMSLNIARVFLFNNYTFIYLFWNIFLAFVPFFISSFLFIYTNKEKIIKPIFVIGFIIWLVFLPNAPYVVTDFIHLGRIAGVPVMYDLFVIFSAATVSLFIGLHSIYQIERIFLLKFSQKITNIIILIVILLASFGVYLGRFLRFNSWDLFTSHISLVSSISKVFTRSNDYINAYTYTFLFFLFIYTSYISFKRTKIL